jgi:hypothetical protein
MASTDKCPRDWAGFCLLAMLGWPKCWRGPNGDRCDETDPLAVMDKAQERAVRNRHADEQLTDAKEE